MLLRAGGLSSFLTDEEREPILRNDHGVDAACIGVEICAATAMILNMLLAVLYLGGDAKVDVGARRNPDTVASVTKCRLQLVFRFRGLGPGNIGRPCLC